MTQVADEEAVRCDVAESMQKFARIDRFFNAVGIGGEQKPTWDFGGGGSDP